MKNSKQKFQCNKILRWCENSKLTVLFHKPIKNILIIYMCVHVYSCRLDDKNHHDRQRKIPFELWVSVVQDTHKII